MTKELEKNFEFWKVNNPNDVRPFKAACRDYEADGKQYTVACLTESEARQLFEQLKGYFE